MCHNQFINQPVNRICESRTHTVYMVPQEKPALYRYSPQGGPPDVRCGMPPCLVCQTETSLPSLGWISRVLNHGSGASALVCSSLRSFVVSVVQTFKSASWQNYRLAAAVVVQCLVIEFKADYLYRGRYKWLYSWTADSSRGRRGV